MTHQRHPCKTTSDRFLATFSHRPCPRRRRRLIGAVIGFYGENPPSWNWIEFVFCATVLALFGDYLSVFFSLSPCVQMASAEFCRSSQRSPRWWFWRRKIRPGAYAWERERETEKGEIKSPGILTRQIIWEMVNACLRRGIIKGCCLVP